MSLQGRDELNRNLEILKEICAKLNKQVDESNDIYYEPCARYKDFSAGVRQVLDGKGLRYNEMYFKDNIEYKTNNEIIEEIKECLIYGQFYSYYPTSMEIKIYEKLKENEWEFKLSGRTLYIQDKQFFIEDITHSEITEDYIKIIFGGQQVEIEKDNIQIQFFINFGEESDDVYVKDLSSKDISFKIANDGLAYAVNGELHLDDSLGDCVICELENIKAITFLTSKNEYMIEFKYGECGFLNEFGFEM